MTTETDDILASLENEAEPDAYRAQRLEQLQSEFSSHQHSAEGHKEQHQPAQHDQLPQDEQRGHGAHNNATTVTTLLNNSDNAVPTLPNDQSVLDFTTQIPQCTVHFFHPDFSRCATMDKHIATLASLHHEGSDGRPVRFARADVRDVPFVVEKLKIRVLPCVLSFRDGVVIDRVLGFEGLGSGGGDAEKTFDTAALEERLVACGVLDVRRVASGEGAADDGDSSADERDEEEEEDGDGYPRRRKVIRSGGIRRNGDDDDDDDWD